MNRRKFLKFLAKGAAIAGMAGVFGLPEVETEVIAIPNRAMFGVKDRNSDIINLHAFDDYLKNDSNNLVWTHEKKQQVANDVAMTGIEYSTQPGTHWPNDGDIINYRFNFVPGSTFTLYELNEED